MRIREPKTTALIFASGKMVVTGAKSEDDSKLASRKYARIIQKLGFNAKFTDFKIQNIVGSCDIKFPIRLEGLASRHHNFSSYEPELFPGLIYRMIKPKIVLLIFVSGKIVLTGAKVREEIYQAFEMIYPVLQGSFYLLRFHCVLLIIRRFQESLIWLCHDLHQRYDHSTHTHRDVPTPASQYQLYKYCQFTIFTKPSQKARALVTSTVLNYTHSLASVISRQNTFHCIAPASGGRVKKGSSIFDFSMLLVSCKEHRLHTHTRWHVRRTKMPS